MAARTKRLAPAAVAFGVGGSAYHGPAMDAFPAFFPLAGRTVVIAGTGEAAEAKLRLFEGSPATLRRLEGAAAAVKPANYRRRGPGLRRQRR